ncbi:MAG: thioredoxin domain-containing protein [Gammaproteobacteria bacterium]|nr:MAG: thioredoxin domain-containing protein [Gammaproteobacteria bacterium]
MNPAANYTNHLANETSPYLLQHAHQPVDWYPWGAEALTRARREQRPILLSIGYSACHWCHVMAHESFDDPEVAAVMNRHFVNVKVDREERPDLDRIYQAAHSLLTGRPGGWPLTVFLTPDRQVPFFAGTYFPRHARGGLPGFVELLESVAAAWRERREDIEQQNAAVLDALARFSRPVPATALPPLRLVDEGIHQLVRQFDPRHGGFGAAPKFPQPTALALLREHARLRDDARIREQVDFTLAQMGRGGLFDQVGGGFCRYATDARWMIPHFEKMLYDNALLLGLYAQAFRDTGDPLFRRVAEATADWAIREMQLPGGGFASSLDADSEGEEGRFYLWTREEVERLLPESLYRPFARHYGLDRRPNFEGRWYPHTFVPVEEIARELDLAPEEVETRLQAARARLFAARERRVRPARDDKVLTSWNALMIEGLVQAATHLERPDYLAAARRAMDFLRTTLWRDGRLLATWKDGRAHLPAYLDDHAFLAAAGLALLEQGWDPDLFAFVETLVETLLARFQAAEGGFWFTADDHEPLLQRPMPVHDEALPAGNGVAVRVLVRLGHLLGRSDWLEAAERALTALGGAMAALPSACPTLLQALYAYHRPARSLVLRGRPEAVAAWRRAVARLAPPHTTCLPIPEPATGLPPALAERRPTGPVTAWLCEGTTCLPPFTHLDALLTELRAAPRA